MPVVFSHGRTYTVPTGGYNTYAWEKKMPGFVWEDGDAVGWGKWRGDPDQDAAHRTILKWLREVVPAGFLDFKDALPNRVKGNLGEFIAYCIGKNYAFTSVSIASGANTPDPLANISKPDVDIVWLNIGERQADDWAVLQEVKTTGQSSLGLADALVGDYEKLFGEDVRLTLQARLGVLKNKLEQMGQGHLSSRITQLTAPSPDLARRIFLVPTLLHDAADDPSAKMVAVRQALIGQGWSADAIRCWSVGLEQIDHRLARIARGQE